ncbi:unnamed protein product, partial [Brassica napus]
VFFFFFLFFSFLLSLLSSSHRGREPEHPFNRRFSRLLLSVASASFLQSPSCPSFSSLVFSDGKGSVSSLQSSLVQSLRPHLLSLLTVGALRDSSQSGAVGASHACCFTEWSSGKKSTFLEVLGFVAC